ncbi:hypothetical protein CVE36_06785 [Pseudomonas syringae pv. actinidiae]|nr:hypothetical protein [Pseudomonas syringae pv. actinidiae]
MQSLKHFKRVATDWFLWGMVLATVLAYFLPHFGATGGSMHAEYVINIGVFVVFFLHGVNLSSEQIKKGLSNWRLHVMIQVFTFVVFPLIWLACDKLLGSHVPALLMLGFFYLRLPESFVPVEDQGYLIIDVQLPPGATRARTDATAQLLETYMLSREATGAVTMLLGFSFSGMGENAGLAFPTLKDWSVRGDGQSAGEEAAAFNQHFAGLSDGTVMAVTPPPIDGLGTSGGFALRLQDRAGLGREALLAARNELLGKANGNPKILYAMMEGLAEAPQLRLNIDREKARALGVSFESISNALSTAFGSSGDQ